MLVFHVDMNFVALREAYLEAWIDRLAAMGYTALLWELEDKVQWDTCPECVHPEAMPKRGIRRLLERAHDLGMQNIPLLQTIGHAEYVLKHPPYHGLREDADFHDCYCASSADVRRLLTDWIAEYCDLFNGLFGAPGRFHLGGDEAYRFATCPDCRRRVSEVGRNGLYAEHMDALAQGIRARGLTPGIWGDMVLTDPEHMDAVPPDFTIWDWNYWDGVEPPQETVVWGRGRLRADEVDEGLRGLIPELLDGDTRLVPFHSARWAARTGREVIVCPAARSSGDSFFYGRHDVHGPNVVGAVRTTQDAALAGACVTSWAIRVHPWETQYPWLHMAAEAYANPETPYSDLEARAGAFLGLPHDEFVMLQQGLGTTYPFARRHECGIQFNGLKDPVPAPDGFIAALLAEWADAHGLIAELRVQVDIQRDALDTAAALLRRLVTGSGVDAVIIESYSRALHFQTWAARFAAEILASSGGSAMAPGTCAAVGATRRAMAGWAGEWMTPISAATIAGLLYEAIEQYCRLRQG